MNEYQLPFLATGIILVGSLVGLAVPAVWWWLRGVRSVDYRTKCRRCGRTGQAHWSLRGCWRYRP